MITELNLNPEEDDIGKRLDIFVAERVFVTRSASQKLIDNGDVNVNGKQVKKNYKMNAKDNVRVIIKELQQADAQPQDIPIEVVYEDECLIVVNKSKGMVVHPAPGNPDNTLVNALLYHCAGSLSGINGVIRPGIVHRIDKNTSGLLIAAKTDEAHIFLAGQIKEHSFERTYQAIVNGNIKNDEGVINAPIARHPTERKKMAVINGGREAVTHYKVIQRYNGFTHLELKLETGRTHQIRVHFSSIGHPIMGDTLYGGGRSKFEQQNAKILCEQCLHAKTLGFIHPKTKEWLRCDSNLPEYFEIILNKLKNH